MDVVPFLTGVVSTNSISINMPHKKLWINSFKTLDNQQRNRFSWGRVKLLEEKTGRRKRNVLRHREVWGFGTILVYVPSELEKDVYPKVGYSSL